MNSKKVTVNVVTGEEETKTPGGSREKPTREISPELKRKAQLESQKLKDELKRLKEELAKQQAKNETLEKENTKLEKQLARIEKDRATALKIKRIEDFDKCNPLQAKQYEREYTKAYVNFLAQYESLSKDEVEEFLTAYRDSYINFRTCWKLTPAGEYVKLNDPLRELGAGEAVSRLRSLKRQANRQLEIIGENLNRLQSQKQGAREGIAAHGNLKSVLMYEIENLEKLIEENTVHKNEEADIPTTERLIERVVEKVQQKERERETMPEERPTYARVLIRNIADKEVNLKEKIQELAAAEGIHPNYQQLKQTKNGNVVLEAVDGDTLIKLQEAAPSKDLNVVNLDDRPVLLLLLSCDKRLYKENLEKEFQRQVQDEEVLFLRPVAAKNESRQHWIVQCRSSLAKPLLRYGSIRLFFRNQRITRYVRPLRCTKCQTLGHTKNRCDQGVPTCGKCAKRHHTNDCSEEAARCANCMRQKRQDKDHEAYSAKCPVYQAAKKQLLGEYYGTSQEDSYVTVEHYVAEEEEEERRRRRRRQRAESRQRPRRREEVEPRDSTPETNRSAVRTPRSLNTRNGRYTVYSNGNRNRGPKGKGPSRY